ncbi:acyltransferase [Nesterenkonia sp. CL21]|uniref:acyltransferase family protein n=1 Tax=Nesterenkonia sp. CL21 TaxID=3064894 RepID=UPI002878C060|nr:acyltransferase [Nesterenkonia sp. CL21]MDS2173128.1 acyltransferase [Nesterenkonia sp. CL21]
MSTPSSPITAQSPASSRMQWMDLLRGVAVILVVILHAASIPTSTGSGIREWILTNRYLEPFRMPLLMFLSGMLLPRSLAKPLPQYLWGKYAAIVWPAAVWMVLYGVFVYRNGPFELSYWITGDYLWFLLALIICYTLAALLQKLPFLLISAAMMAAVVLMEVPSGLPHKTLYYGAFFFLGAWACRYMDRWLRAPWMLVVAMAVVAAVFSHLGREDLALRMGTWQAAGISLLGLGVILWLAPRLPRGRISAFFEWAGRSSIVVYVAHFPILVVIHRVLARMEVAPIWHVGITTVLGLALTLLMVWLRPWTTWLYVYPRQKQVATRLKERAARQKSAPAATPTPGATPDVGR